MSNFVHPISLPDVINKY